MTLQSFFGKKKEEPAMQTTPRPASQEAQQVEPAALPTGISQGTPVAVEPEPTTSQPVPPEPRKTTPELKTLGIETQADTTSGAIRPEVRPHAFVIMPF